jgi:hypothetical protein
MKNLRTNKTEQFALYTDLEIGLGVKFV